MLGTEPDKYLTLAQKHKLHTQPPLSSDNPIRKECHSIENEVGSRSQRSERQFKSYSRRKVIVIVIVRGLRLPLTGKNFEPKS